MEGKRLDKRGHRDACGSLEVKVTNYLTLPLKAYFSANYAT